MKRITKIQNVRIEFLCIGLYFQVLYISCLYHILHCWSSFTLFRLSLIFSHSRLLLFQYLFAPMPIVYLPVYFNLIYELGRLECIRFNSTIYKWFLSLDPSSQHATALIICFASATNQKVPAIFRAFY